MLCWFFFKMYKKKCIKNSGPIFIHDIIYNDFSMDFYFTEKIATIPFKTKIPYQTGGSRWIDDWCMLIYSWGEMVLIPCPCTTILNSFTTVIPMVLFYIRWSFRNRCACLDKFRSFVPQFSVSIFLPAAV